MGNSNTPRTDKKASGIIGFFSCETVPASFARELEQELSDAIAALTELRRWVADGDCSDDIGIWPKYATQAYKETVEKTDAILSGAAQQPAAGKDCVDRTVRLTVGRRGYVFRAKITSMANTRFAMDDSGDVYPVRELRRDGVGTGTPDEALYVLGNKIGRGFRCLPDVPHQARTTAGSELAG